METGLSRCHNKNKPLTAELPSSTSSHTEMTVPHLVSANILVGSNASLLIQTAKPDIPTARDNTRTKYAHRELKNQS